MMARSNLVSELLASLLLLSVLGSGAQTTVTNTTTDLKEAVRGIPAEGSHVFTLGAGTFSCFGGISVGGVRNITFIGAGASSTVINCDGNSKHFIVESAGSLTLQGIKLLNGSSAEGGAIEAKTSAKVFLKADVEIESCKATGKGGAINLVGASKLECDATVFKSNTAGDKGGAIYLVGASKLDCDATVFKSNTAGDKGGAIYLDGSSTVGVTGAASFDGNTAANGGAIAFATVGSTVNIASSAVITGNIPGTSDFSVCFPAAAIANATFDGLVIMVDGVCSSKCNSGFTAMSGNFRDPGTCNVCGATCDIGKKDTTCTAYSAGTCTDCTQVANGVFTSSGKGSNPDFECDFSCNSDYYKWSTSCMACNLTSCGVGYFRTVCGSSTDSQCAQCTGLPSNALWTSTGTSTEAPGGCAWECEAGWYKNGTQCAQCLNTTCPVGQYRGACGGNLDGACRPCSGPGSSLFITAGSPYDQDNCGWICNANGIANNSWWNPVSPPVAMTTPAPAAANSSSGGNSSNATRRLLQANETTASPQTTPMPQTTPAPTEPAGWSAFSAANCVPGEYLGKCWCEKCTNGGNDAIYDTVGGYDANDCKFECEPGAFRNADGKCVACQKDSPACPVGQKRGACTSESPQGPCLACDNAPVGAVYLEASDDVAECNWRCPLGYPVVDGVCSLCRIDKCAIGGYRSGCTAEGNGGSCLPCTGKPKLATYSTPGFPFDQDKCEWICYSADEEPVREADCCPIANLTMIVKLSVATSTNVEDLVSALEKVVESLAVNTTERVCVSAEVYKPATVTGEAQGGGEASVTGRRQSSEVSIQTVVNAPGSDLEEIEYSVTSSAIQEGLAAVGITATVSEITVTVGHTERGGGPDVGVIVGSVIGGLAGVALIGAAYWKFSAGGGISMPSFSSPKSPGRHTPAAGGHKAATPIKPAQDEREGNRPAQPTSADQNKDIETSVAPTATATMPSQV